MTNRFYIPAMDIQGRQAVITDEKIIHQISKVLRLHDQDHICVFTSHSEFDLAIIKIEKNKITAEIIKQIEKNREPKNKIFLYQALLKKDKFEWVVQKASELGVNTIIPIVTDNAITRELSPNKMARYKKIAIEATEQSGGIKPPEITESMEFQKVISKLSDLSALKIIAWEGEQHNSIKKILNQKIKEIHIIIGPEGGFTSKEVNLAVENKITPVTLGQRILRAETAAIATIILFLLSET